MKKKDIKVGVIIHDPDDLYDGGFHNSLILSKDYTVTTDGDIELEVKMWDHEYDFGKSSQLQTNMKEMVVLTDIFQEPEGREGDE